MAQRVLVDANVLFSRTIRDWLFNLELAAGTMFSTCTTEDIIAEVLHRTRKKRPAAPGGVIASLGTQIRRYSSEIITDFDCSVEYDGEDPDDLHVHAAAVTGQVDILLTMDHGFEALEKRSTLPYSVYSADAFFSLIDDSSPSLVRKVTSEQRKFWAERPGSKGLVQALENAGCPDFADRVNGHLATEAGIAPYSIERKRVLATPRK